MVFIRKIMVHRKIAKVSIYWSSKVSKRYKSNAILGDLHRTKGISSDFNAEVAYIIEKFMNADCPLQFINNVMNDSVKLTYDSEDLYITPPNLLEFTKTFHFD